MKETKATRNIEGRTLRLVGELQQEARACAAEAERLAKRAAALARRAEELAREADAGDPAAVWSKDVLEGVLRRIDGVLEWRYVNAFGETELDPDALSAGIDCETLCLMRACVARALGQRGEDELQ